MKYKCLIVDDEPLARELLASHLSNFDDFELVCSFENALEAYQYLGKNEADLLFLDIEMPLLKGNNFLKTLKNPPKTIFTTAYREYALEGYELNVMDYLLKPITFERFFVSIEKFKNNLQQQNRAVNLTLRKEESFFVSSAGKNIKIVFDEIIYIESMKDYITIHLINGNSHYIKYNISAFEKLLTPDFIRVHRSYIIHKNKISAYSKHEIAISNKEIPIGISYKENWERFIRNIK